LFSFSKKKSPILGVDINSNTISLLDLDQARQGAEMLHYASQPTPPNTVREGLLADPETIGSVLRSTIEQSGLTPAQGQPTIRVSVPGQSVVVRLIPVPIGMPPDELADVVAQEAINHVPFPVSEANLDWSIMPATERTDPDGVSRVDVILVAMQKSIVDTYWRMCDAAGVKLGRIDTTSLSTIRGLVFANYLPADNDLYMLVNIRQDATDINLVRNAMPLFSRSVLLGMETLGEAIARSLEVPLSESFHMLSQVQLTGSAPLDARLGQAAQIARTVFGDITDEVGRSLEFYRSQVGEVQIKQMLLCGPGAVIPQIEQFIANRLNVPAEIVNPLRQVSRDQTLVPDSLGAGLTLALGNVVDSSWSPITTVNVDLNKEGPSVAALEGMEMRPTVQVYSEQTKWFLPVLAGGVACLIMVAGLWAYWSQYDVPKKKAEIAMITSEIEQEKKQLQNTSKIKESNAALLSKKSLLDGIVKNGPAFAPILQNISNNTPQGVQLSKVLILNNRLLIEGHAVDFKNVSHLAINLGGSPFLTDASFSWAKRQGTSGGDPRVIDFQVVAQVVGAANAAPQIAATGTGK